MAVLVGVDATPEPGLRGPTNFAGTLLGETLERLNQTLTAARQAILTPVMISLLYIIIAATLIFFASPHVEQTHDALARNSSTAFGRCRSYMSKVFDTP